MAAQAAVELLHLDDVLEPDVGQEFAAFVWLKAACTAEETAEHFGHEDDADAVITLVTAVCGQLAAVDRAPAERLLLAAYAPAPPPTSRAVTSAITFRFISNLLFDKMKFMLHTCN